MGWLKKIAKKAKKAIAKSKGTLLGAAKGFLAGGPLGAVAGAGSALMKELHKEAGKAKGNPDPHARTGLIAGAAAMGKRVIIHK